MTVNSSANSVILIVFAFSDNLSAENSKSSADFSIQLIQLLECMPNKLGPENTLFCNTNHQTRFSSF